MYYILSKKTKGTNRYFSCFTEKDQWSDDYIWIKGEKINENLNLPLKYHAKNKLIPEDFPFVMPSGYPFLVSKKIIDIFDDLKIPNLEKYESVIVKKDNSDYNNYFTINILNFIDCIDKKKTKYSTKYSGDDIVKLVLLTDKIPENIKLFRLFDKELLKIVHQDVKILFEKEKITGVEFIPVEEYTDLW